MSYGPRQMFTAWVEQKASSTTLTDARAALARGVAAARAAYRQHGLSLDFIRELVKEVP